MKTGTKRRQIEAPRHRICVITTIPVVSDAFASATSRQLVLAVPEADEEQLGEVLAAVGDDRVRVVGRG